MSPFWREYVWVIGICALLIAQHFAIVWLENRKEVHQTKDAQKGESA